MNSSSIISDTGCSSMVGTGLAYDGSGRPMRSTWHTTGAATHHAAASQASVRALSRVNGMPSANSTP